MRTTRAYIASAGTAAVMLGAALCMLVIVSAFVAFGSWPGESSGKQVDQVLLNDVVRPQPHNVAVGSEAVKVARRAETRRQLAEARRRGKTGTGTTRDGNAIARTPAGTAAPTTRAGTPVAAAPGGGGSGPAETVRQQTQDVTKTLDNTTKTVTDPVQNQVDQTTTQVNQVVDQVVGAVPQQTGTTVQQVQDTVGSTVGSTVDTTTNTVTGTVKDTAGGLLGH